jgi:hypothetical protein
MMLCGNEIGRVTMMSEERITEEFTVFTYSGSRIKNLKTQGN